MLDLYTLHVLSDSRTGFSKWIAKDASSWCPIMEELPCVCVLP